MWVHKYFYGCGPCKGLDLGWECFKKWGYRRCEDICWVKINCNNPCNNEHKNTKEHCLMGIKEQSEEIKMVLSFMLIIIDLDINITEEPTIGGISKPEEIFHIIEHFWNVPYHWALLKCFISLSTSVLEEKDYICLELIISYTQVG